MADVKDGIHWYGLEPERFSVYKNWENTHQPGLCGTYVVAVMIHDLLRQEYGIDMNQDQLIQGVRPVVDDRWPYRGTFFWDLIYGLNFVLKELKAYRANYHVFAEMKVPEVLESKKPRPVIVGTAGLLGSKYKNHWLLAYAYGYDDRGELYLKCYDNHGRHDAVVAAKETLNCVWLAERARPEA